MNQISKRFEKAVEAAKAWPVAHQEAAAEVLEGRNPRVAKRVRARIKQAIGRLARHPYSCRATEHPGIRVLSVVSYPYLVFYSVDDAAREVHILRIRHSAQDPSHHLD
jgi:plasmid stabilization system protein ParE